MRWIRSNSENSLDPGIQYRPKDSLFPPRSLHVGARSRRGLPPQQSATASTSGCCPGSKHTLTAWPWLREVWVQNGHLLSTYCVLCAGPGTHDWDLVCIPLTERKSLPAPKDYGNRARREVTVPWGGLGKTVKELALELGGERPVNQSHAETGSGSFPVAHRAGGFLPLPVRSLRQCFPGDSLLSTTVR